MPEFFEDAERDLFELGDMAWIDEKDDALAVAWFQASASFAIATALREHAAALRDVAAALRERDAPQPPFDPGKMR